ncbi:MAG: transposase [Deltaproteobacteria bacterium]|nr:transposase [Deltaproteobacteria bacterium]
MPQTTHFSVRLSAKLVLEFADFLNLPATVVVMPTRRIFNIKGHAHFVTFSCYHRRRLLNHDRAKQIVLSVFALQVEKQQVESMGFVIMPDHVHSLIMFSGDGDNTIGSFMKQWKQQSSVQLKKFLSSTLTEYTSKISLADPVWQRRYYDYNVYSERKLTEKLEYMHNNPVRAGLVRKASDWRYSSAWFYEYGKACWNI